MLTWALAANVSPQIAAGVGAPKQSSSSERHPWVLGMGGVQGGAPHAGERGRHRAGSIPGAGGLRWWEMELLGQVEGLSR